MSWHLVRFWLARHMIHAGLRIMPVGRARDQLAIALWDYGEHIREAAVARRFRP